MSDPTSASTVDYSKAVWLRRAAVAVALVAGIVAASWFVHLKSSALHNSHQRDPFTMPALSACSVPLGAAVAASTYMLMAAAALLRRRQRVQALACVGGMAVCMLGWYLLHTLVIATYLS